MSRSIRHTPIVGMTPARSDKPGKVAAHRKHRAASRQAIHREAVIMPDERETGNPWSFPKDGKQWLDIERNPELARYLRK